MKNPIEPNPTPGAVMSQEEADRHPMRGAGDHHAVLQDREAAPGADFGGAEKALIGLESPIREARADEERFAHLPFLGPIALGDVAQLERKDREYGGSWKKRGGVGVFMMLVRKSDRLENMVDELKSYVVARDPQPGDVSPLPAQTGYVAGPYDLFSHAIGAELEGGKGEKLLDTLGDLRRYALLAEAEIRRRLGQTPEQAQRLVAEAN